MLVGGAYRAFVRECQHGAVSESGFRLLCSLHPSHHIEVMSTGLWQQAAFSVPVCGIICVLGSGIKLIVGRL